MDSANIEDNDIQADFKSENCDSFENIQEESIEGEYSHPSRNYKTLIL